MRRTGGPNPERDSRSQIGRRRRELVLEACQACRRRKSKVGKNKSHDPIVHLLMIIPSVTRFDHVLSALASAQYANMRLWKGRLARKL